MAQRISGGNEPPPKQPLLIKEDEIPQTLTTDKSKGKEKENPPENLMSVQSKIKEKDVTTTQDDEAAGFIKAAKTSMRVVKNPRTKRSGTDLINGNEGNPMPLAKPEVPLPAEPKIEKRSAPTADVKDTISVVVQKFSAVPVNVQLVESNNGLSTNTGSPKADVVESKVTTPETNQSIVRSNLNMTTERSLPENKSKISKDNKDEEIEPEPTYMIPPISSKVNNYQKGNYVSNMAPAPLEQHPSTLDIDDDDESIPESPPS